ncbi:MAG: hypothetical protein CVV41_06855 [Candidatus Riflebacteria bacterium HGW-Riflebacteria-1]|jgi:hypothetical protein|nr:MAG: hypothetical protein CVV41_06855 [Candidatus Riflebacteria bacterium HGW-Riflebacteria-1]
MNKWFSTAELAGLDGLPTTKYGIVKKARNENWQSRERQGRGGGLEYHISSLPQETQRALAIKNTNDTIKAMSAEPAFKEGKAEAAKLKIKEEISQKVTQAKRLDSLNKSEGLTGMSRDRMNAKLEIIKLWETFKKTCTETTTAAQFLFCHAYNQGQIQAPEWVRGVIEKTSQPSLMKWLKKYRQEGITALAGNYGTRRGSGIFYTNKALYDLAVAMMTEFPHCDAKQVSLAIEARKDKMELEEVPHVKTIARFMEAWKNNNKQVFEFIQSPDAWRGKRGAAFGDASAGIDRYLQCWEMDSTPTDVMLKDGRHTLVGVIDIKTRRAKMLVNKTSKAVAVAALVRRAILDWGVPESIKTDNGSDYTSKYLVEAFNALEIEHLICAPFSPDRKPFIESFFGTFNHSLFPLCQEYLGCSVAERKKIEDRKSFAQRHGDKSDPIELGFMDAVQLQEFCDKWTDHLYFNTPHEGLDGKTPADAVAACINEGFLVRRISDVRALDYLLAEAPGGGTRVVGKKGIAIDHFSFVAPELACYIGETVVVKYDPFDAGKIMVFNADRDYICTAIRPELLGLPRSEVAAVSRAKQKEFVSAKKRELKKLAGTANLKNITGEILQNYVDKSVDRPLPEETTAEYNTRALQAASDAVIVNDAMSEPTTFEEINAAAATLSPEAEKRLAEIVDLDSRRRSEEEREQDEKKARVARYEALRAVNFKGISEEDDRWRRSWEQTPEGRTHERMKRLAEENQLVINAK